MTIRPRIEDNDETLPNQNWWEDASANLIQPNTITGTTISTIFIAIHTLDIVIFTYIAAFRTHSLGRPLFTNWEIFADLVLVVNIILNFFTALEKQTTTKGKQDSFLKWETNMKVIAISYLRGFFLIDCLGCLPTLITLSNNSCIFYCKFFRLVSVPKLYLMQRMVEEQVKKMFYGRLTSILNVI